MQALKLAVAVCLLLVGMFTTSVQPFKDVEVFWGPRGTYNPSLIEYQGKFLAALRASYVAQLNQQDKVVKNEVHVCAAHEDTEEDLTRLKCKRLHFWHTQAVHNLECPWTRRIGKLKDVTGPEDVRLWPWPGKGVYAIFGRKANKSGPDGACPDRLRFAQFLAQVAVEPSNNGTFDPWLLKDVLALKPPEITSYSSGSHAHTVEKNWMPFIWTDEKGKEHLYITYSIVPHVVCELHPNGTTVSKYTSRNDTLFGSFEAFKLHGGPPVIKIAAEQSKLEHEYYLGIIHHNERISGGKLYRHFAYRFHTVPPFKIFDVSDELPLVFHIDNSSIAMNWQRTTAGLAWVGGLHLSTQQKKDPVVYISYGSADSHAHVLRMPLEELESMFTGKVSRIKHDLDSLPK